MKIYEVTDRIEYILATQVDDDGYMTEETAIALDDLIDTREEKLINLLLYYKGELAEGDAVQNEAGKLLARAERHLTRAKWIKDYVLHNTVAGERITDPRVTATRRQTTAVTVFNEDVVPEEYRRSTVTTTVNKTEAKKALKEGQEIPGLELEKRWHLIVK